MSVRCQPERDRDHSEQSVVGINKKCEGLVNLLVAAELLNSIPGLRNNSIDAIKFLHAFEQRIGINLQAAYKEQMKRILIIKRAETTLDLREARLGHSTNSRF